MVLLTASVLASAPVQAAAASAAAQVPLSFTNPLPGPTLAYEPHVTFKQIQDELFMLRSLGFRAIRLPPVNPPGIKMFQGEKVAPENFAFHGVDGIKQGSAYAIRNPHAISPVMAGLVDPAAYLAHPDQLTLFSDEAEKRFRDLVQSAARLGIQITCDLVLNHVSRDIEEEFTQQFGKDALLHNELDDGNDANDNWIDVVPLNHSGPAGNALLAYHLGAYELLARHGVGVFRIDAASFIPKDYLTRFIAGAKHLAEQKGYLAPLFFGETLGKGTSPSDIIAAGCVGATTSFAWWDIFKNSASDWALPQYEHLRTAGGIAVNFASTHDTHTMAHWHTGTQDFLRTLILSFLWPGDVFVQRTTLDLNTQQPPHFLRDIGHPDLQPKPDPSASKITYARALIKKLADLYNRFKIFSAPAHVTETHLSSGIRVLTLNTPTEEALIVMNTSDNDVNYQIPPLYQQKGTNGANANMIWANNDYWGTVHDDIPLHDFKLSRGGVAVFHRTRKQGEVASIPGYN
ncbi:MAG: hypothetical protein HQM16_11335 [Deltaproteobacteria bacterium]|nr:hypothetical protein [Deltaproteobacteria bacterium]